MRFALRFYKGRFFDLSILFSAHIVKRVDGVRTSVAELM